VLLQIIPRFGVRGNLMLGGINPHFLLRLSFLVAQLPILAEV